MARPTLSVFFAVALSLPCSVSGVHWQDAEDLEGPCDSATIIEDDWRYPSEENNRKCDNRLRSGVWYKFKYQGQPAVVAQGPIKENHCSTSGPISVSLQSERHLYPPPRNQSALYKACVHVKVMDVATCVDHLTIPLLVMTCPDNDVIYFVNQTIKDCPSAFCIIGREESVDKYYLMDSTQDGKYYDAVARDHASIDVWELTHYQREGVVTYITDDVQESVARFEELKRHISKALNLKSWSNCIGSGAKKSSECFDYEKSLIRHSIAALGKIISQDTNDTVESSSLPSDTQEEVTNASGLSYQSSIIKYAGSLCQVHPEDVKVVNLRRKSEGNTTRNSLYVESFCGITCGSDLMKSLIWLNSTGILGSVSEAEVIEISMGIPADQLPAVKVSELRVGSAVWASIFCCAFVVCSCLSSVCFFFRVRCVASNHMNQKEKICVIDCDGRTEWLSGPSKRHLRKSRYHTTARHLSLSATSREAYQRQTSSMTTATTPTTRRFSITSKSTIVSFLGSATPSQFKKWFRTEESLSSRVTQKSSAESASPASVRDLHQGWMVPLRDFQKGRPSHPIPRLVVDTKRRSIARRNSKQTTERHHLHQQQQQQKL